MEKAAEAYISVEKGVESVQDAINGAMDILAEGISDDAKYRTYIRNITMNKVFSISSKDGEKQSFYETYYNYEEPVKKSGGHRILALNRGEDEKNPYCKGGSANRADLRIPGKTGDHKGKSIYHTCIKGSDPGQLQPVLIAPSVERGDPQ